MSCEIHVFSKYGGGNLRNLKNTLRINPAEAEFCVLKIFKYNRQ